MMRIYRIKTLLVTYRRPIHKLELHPFGYNLNAISCFVFTKGFSSTFIGGGFVIINFRRKNLVNKMSSIVRLKLLLTLKVSYSFVITIS